MCIFGFTVLLGSTWVLGAGKTMGEGVGVREEWGWEGYQQEEYVSISGTPKMTVLKPIPPPPYFLPPHSFPMVPSPVCSPASCDIITTKRPR